MFLDNYRPEVWKTSLRHLQTDPFFGTGGGTYVVFSRLYRSFPSGTDDYHAHNDWMQVASEYGIIGFALFLLAIIVHFHAGWQGYLAALRYRLSIGSLPQSNSAALLMGALAVFAVFVVHSLTDFNLQIPPNALLAAAVAGILAGSRPENVSGEARSAPRWQRIFYTSLAGTVAISLLMCVWHSRGEAAALQAENELLKNHLDSAALKAISAVAAEPGNPWVHHVAGRVAAATAGTFDGQFRAEEKETATRNFQAALTLSPQESTFRSALVSALIDQGRLDAARDQAIQNLVSNPLRDSTWMQLGMIAQQQGNLSLAVQYYAVVSGMPSAAIDRKKLKLLQDRERAGSEHSR